MELRPDEIAALRATLGHNLARVFCPPASVHSCGVENWSYSLWLGNRADFVSVFSEPLPPAPGQVGEEYRLAAERSDRPRGFDYHPETNSVDGCSDIYLDRRLTIARVEVYGGPRGDRCVVFRGSEGHAFSLSLDYWEVWFQQGAAAAPDPDLTPRVVVDQAGPGAAPDPARR
jgi:hypothetical protein